MSGNLNILRHKSWNVWNPENAKRVEKDEAEAKLEKDVEKTGLRLFEGSSSSSQGRKRTRKSEDSKRKREDGVPLGMGSTERSSHRPFYLTPGVTDSMPEDARRQDPIIAYGRVVRGTDAADARIRDDRRKQSADPMRRFVSSSPSDPLARPEPRVGHVVDDDFLSSTILQGDGPPDMEALRARRLRREAVERKRAAKLFRR